MEGKRDFSPWVWGIVGTVGTTGALLLIEVMFDPMLGEPSRCKGDMCIDFTFLLIMALIFFGWLVIPIGAYGGNIGSQLFRSRAGAVIGGALCELILIGLFLIITDGWPIVRYEQLNYGIVEWHWFWEKRGGR